MPCNYHFVTCHIPSLMNWIVYRKIEEFKAVVPRNRVFMGVRKGKCVAIRNPITAPSEVGLIQLEKDDCKYTKHLKHIVQFGEGDYMMRMNQDYDGDKLCLFNNDINYRNIDFNYLEMYKNTIYQVEDKDCPALEYFDLKYKEALDEINPNRDEAIYLTDFVHKLPCQVNYDDKTGSITNKAIQVGNRALDESDYKKYEYEIMYAKYLQGLQIDVSKNMKEVIIDDVYSYSYNKKPQFLYYNYRGKKWRYDKNVSSALDSFAEIIMMEYLKHCTALINKNTIISS
ncbi:hypothetical protein IZY60_14450 [Lutibacter sp. B2]|nr:hypothetical protein [Lutibacter sp. B2]